jgi:hypothetical protein
MNAATRAVAGETHAVGAMGAMVQEKRHLHAPLVASTIRSASQSGV